ncbi:MAG: hypothetical protein CMA31_07030 [Euryarchaeota archaeon]|nr:hypothetical protein [Euryarchaeota archaeon]RPG72203.1 MAG: hypothetical protein CBD52_002950 [Euryarchaeota archaeon TMED192]|tara:strand:- start:546 stop:932 length:387 start_codon:yes stop_codon:yes gene_type:complete
MASTRASRLLVVGLLITVLVLAMLIQAQPLPQITVDELVENSNIHEGKEVHVRGIVVEGSTSENGLFFILGGNDYQIDIDVSGISTPEGLVEGSTVVVQGKFRPIPGGWEIDATQVQTGCPSKYESDS